MIRAVLLLLLLGIPAAHAQCCEDDDDDALSFLHRDHGDYAVGRRTNETWDQFYARSQRQVEQEFNQRRR